MSQNPSLQMSRYRNHILLLSRDQWQKVLPDGVYLRLGKVLKEPKVEKKDLISILEENKREIIGFVASEDGYEEKKIGEEKALIIPKRPMIQISLFSFGICSEGKIIEDYYGGDSIYFGLKVSYPLLYSDGKEIGKTRSGFSEYALFHNISQYSRRNTVPIRLQYRGALINTTYRIGEGIEKVAVEKIQKIEGLNLQLVNNNQG